MMRIWHQSITSLEALGAYAEALRARLPDIVSGGTDVVLHGLPAGSYAGRAPSDVLRYAYARYKVHDQILGQVAEAERQGFDAVAFVTFAEPLLDQARSLVDIPVISMLEATLLVGCSLARRIALVTLGPNSVPRLRDQVSRHGLADRIGGVYSLEPAVNETELMRAFADPAPVVEAFLKAAAKAVAEGADVVIPAEGVLNEVLAASGIRTIEGARILDCTAVTLAYTEMLVQLRRRSGLGVGRRWDYARAPAELMAALNVFFGDSGTGR